MAEPQPNRGPQTPDQGTPDAGRANRRDQDREPRELSPKEQRKREAARRAREKREEIEQHKAAEDALDEAFKAAGGPSEREPGTFSEVKPGPGGMKPLSLGESIVSRYRKNPFLQNRTAKRRKENWWIQKNLFLPRFHGKGWGRVGNFIGSIALAVGGAFHRAAKLVEKPMLIVENLFAGTSWPWLPGGKKGEAEITGPLYEEDEQEAA